jgi:hypothetical protein
MRSTQERGSRGAARFSIEETELVCRRSALLALISWRYSLDDRDRRPCPLESMLLVHLM